MTVTTDTAEPERMSAGLASVLVILLACAVPLILSGLVSAGSTDAWYAALRKPPFNPPDIAFAIVWPTLYLLMAVSGYMVLRRAGSISGAPYAFSVFFLQLALNLAWSWLFFFFHRPEWALIDLAALLVAISLMMSAFGRYSKAAAMLQLPYLFWVFFAGYLNTGIVLLN